MNVSSLCVSHTVFTNLYDCAHVALVDEDGNQNCVGPAVILPPKDASFREVEESQVEGEVGYDHHRMEEIVAIYDD